MWEAFSVYRSSELEERWDPRPMAWNHPVLILHQSEEDEDEVYFATVSFGFLSARKTVLTIRTVDAWIRVGLHGSSLVRQGCR